MPGLRAIFDQRTEGDVHKWTNYFSVYERHLAALCDKPIVFLEIGICDGGSLKMWRSYFGPRATIVGIDVNPACRRFADDGTHVEIGDQADPDFLEGIARKYGPFDVVLDDGGHTMRQQRVTLDTLFPHVKENGLFIVEDTHTSYWPAFGVSREKSFMDYAKELVDRLNGWFIVSRRDPVDAWTRNVAGMHFYPSMVVFEKAPVDEPLPVRSGCAETAVGFQRQFAGSLVGKTPWNDIVWGIKAMQYRLLGNPLVSDYYLGCIRLRREQSKH